MNGDSWIERVRAFGVRHVAELLGLDETRKGSLSPCPACGAVTRGSSDKRGPIGLEREGVGWKCHLCQAKGDAVTLVSVCVLGRPLPLSESGWQTVRAWCAEHRLCEPRGAVAAPVALLPIPPARPPAPPRRPDSDELLDLFLGTMRVTQDAEVAAFLARRGLDAAEVERREIAWALRPGAELPAWARFRGRPWTLSGHRLIVGLVDANGDLMSVQARSVLVDVPKGEKAANPAGVDLRGLVMADARGLALLKGIAPLPREVWIAEGVPDFLTLAINWPADSSAPAVFGIAEGCWTPELAARVPMGAKVVLMTDHDANGDRYAAAIKETLAGRRVFRHTQGRREQPAAEGETHGRT